LDAIAGGGGVYSGDNWAVSGPPPPFDAYPPLQHGEDAYSYMRLFTGFANLDKNEF
jgi:hypothetical protein